MARASWARRTERGTVFRGSGEAEEEQEEEEEEEEEESEA